MSWHLSPIDWIPERLRPSQRVLVIDLSKKRGELVNEFNEYLDLVYHMRESEHCPETWKENYSQWEPDKSRFRSEVWNALKVYRLRRKKKAYKEIAQTLGMKVSAAKMAFRRAYNLIENRPYDKDYFRREAQIQRVTELRKTCETCELHETCKELCPDVLFFVEQDRINQQELLIDSSDPFGSSDPFLTE